MIEKYKHIIWDWNGTLFNDIHLCVELINGLLVPRKLNPLTVEEYRDVFTFPVKDYYAKAGLDFDRYSFEDLGAEWMNNYEERKFETGLFDDAVKVLAYIANLGIPQSILSAYKQHTLEEIIEHFHLKKYFTHLVGLDHIYATSKLDLGKELIKKLGNKKGEVLLIGDTIHDNEVAEEIGADCILIASGHQSKERLEKCGVKVLNNIREIIS